MHDPRIELQVMLNGSQVQGLLHASIVATNCFSSDSFALTFALGAPPLCDIALWSSVSDGYIEIGVAASYEPTPQSLISGMIDTIVIDPIRGTAAIEGRDLSSTMIDSYRQQDYVNQTASEVVSTIASYHGLVPAVTATSANVGRYYGDGYTRLSLGQFSRLRSDWDLVVQLARENNFDVFVQGSTLFFQPSTSFNGIPVQIALRNVKTMRLERTLTIRSTAIARVQSWNSQNMTSYTSNSAEDGAGATPAPAATDNQPFLFSASNFTSQQVADSASRYASELNHLGIAVHIEMPWDLALSPRTIIMIDETDSAFDATYKIDHMERHYSTTSGSSQTFRAATI
jgi:hypothetical protein